MDSDKNLRLICLVYPLLCDEAQLLAGRGSLSIIAAEQYLLLKGALSDYDVLLYSEQLDSRDTDVLVVMTCIHIVTEKILKNFKRIVYFFDDLNQYKLKEERYAIPMSFVTAVWHPVRSAAEQLDKIDKFQVKFLPWSLARIPTYLPQKTLIPTFFVDMDDRPYYLPSIRRGIEFISSFADQDFKFLVPENYAQQVPSELHKCIQFIPFLPHDQFLQVLGQSWFYVSGIPGSYEFPALEASFMGCGLISLNGALRDAHAGGTYFLDIEADRFDHKLLVELISRFSSDTVISEAHVRYPTNYPNRIPELLKNLCGHPLKCFQSD